ncbi:MAG: tetratricopeptide repeat protein, partial [Alphaproteobacteria bacterium]|nr:tetratricopeptide repeat protein [Alphaproteobacteria bacterium]
EVRRPLAAPPAPPPLPSVEELRAALLAGQLDQAREGLERRLARAPGEVDAWTLLAQAERKAGRTAEAVRAWREVIARGAPAEAQRARFEAARLLEAQPAEAEPLLRAFLQTPDPLAAEARLRLGKAILAQGRRDEAAQTLEVLVSEHPGSASARAARALLEEIRSEGER